MQRPIAFLAAVAALLAAAPGPAAHAQGVRTVCQRVWQPDSAVSNTGRWVRVCDRTYTPSTPSARRARAEAPAARETGSSESVHYNPLAEAHKAQLNTNRPLAPGETDLCPPPYRMTERNGCQR